jgi:hypothetical protein
MESRTTLSMFKTFRLRIRKTPGSLVARTQLTKSGLVYKEGISDPKRVTVTIMNMSQALKGVLDTAYNDKTRLEVFAIDRNDGSSKIARNAILSQQPQQLTLDESPESMNVSLVFESFDLSETHKS